MSRIGRSPIAIPPGVEVKISETNVVTVKGPKGTLEQPISPDIEIEVEGTTINLTRPSDAPKHRSIHGLSRTLVSNMITGVTDGFTKELDINGVGYRATMESNKLVMNLGYSHQIIMEIVDGVSIDVPTPTKIIVSGINKQVVGQFAADIRKKRPPAPYIDKGTSTSKGIKYANEVVRLKEGKTGVK